MVKIGDVGPFVENERKTSFFDDFIYIFGKIFDAHTPLKLKYIIANGSPFMIKNYEKLKC